MLTPVRQLTYVIVLRDDIGRMKAFYRDLLPFAVDSEAVTGGSKDAGYVHIRVQKLNGRKCITTITGRNTPQ